MGPTLDGANAGWRPPPSPRSIPRRRYHFHSMPVHSKRMAWRNPRVSPPATLPHDTGRPARVLWARTSLSHAGGTWEVCDRGHTGAERPIDPYWPGHAVRRADATVLAAGRAERGAAAGQGARAGAPAWRGPGAVPRRAGPRGAARAALRASGRRPELWAARGWGVALPVPRLAVRCHRPVPGAARRARGQHLQGPRAAAGVSVCREGWRHFRLPGPWRAAAAAAVRLPPCARRPRRGDQGLARVQLPPGQ